MEDIGKNVFTAVANDSLANFKVALDAIHNNSQKNVHIKKIISLRLTSNQSLTLFFSGFANINGIIYKEISRHDNITDAFKLSMPLDLIAEDRSNFYVLGEV